MAYWLEELTGVGPLVAPLILEAVIHTRAAEHFLSMPWYLAWLMPATIGLAAVRTAFYLDRARLNGQPTGLIRFGLYGFMAAGFAVSYWFLTTVPANGATAVAKGAELPAVVAGLFSAASVFMWELRVRQRRQEVERANRQNDPDSLRRAWTFPIWHRRMRRWAIATGQRDTAVVVAAFAPLIVGKLAGDQVARYPELVDQPTSPTSQPGDQPALVAANPTSATSLVDQPTNQGGDQPTRPTNLVGHVVDLVARDQQEAAWLQVLIERYPANQPVPSRTKIEQLLGVGSTRSRRLVALLANQRNQPTNQDTDQPTRTAAAR